jgi:HAD superfamily hydrolase (TIGR01490 family)
VIDPEILRRIDAALAHSMQLSLPPSGSAPVHAPSAMRRAPSAVPPAPCASRHAPSLAFFDLDGTLSRGHMIFDFPTHLLAAGLFSRPKHDAITRVRTSFSAGKLTYRMVAEDLPLLYAQGVKGQQASNISLEAEKFVENRMGNVFSYARPLVLLMREHGRPGIALSGSPIETVKGLARRLGMEAAFGTELEVTNGLFTGKILHNFILLETKKAFFEELVQKLKLDTSWCFGFGDTEQDLSFLERVGHPVALNAGGELRAQALKHGWPLFGEAQDVVGEVQKLLGD